MSLFNRPSIFLHSRY